MTRFMKNGVVHNALSMTTEFLTDEFGKVEVIKYVLSSAEEASLVSNMTVYEWTPLDFIEVLPSSINWQSSEWTIGTTGETL
jgi:hypothetical protein